MKKSFLYSAALIAILGTVFVHNSTAQSPWSLAGAKTGQALQIDPVRGVLTMAPLLEKTTPAVVNISVSSTVKMQANRFAGQDEFFERFFGDKRRAPNRNDDDRNDDGNNNERTQKSVGSGVIINAGKGYILTNHHVIDNADKITITLKDKRTAIATLIGSDAGTDVALLKIDLKGLSDLTLANSDQVKVGDYVIAIGNSFGIGQSVTSGIVSALGRSTFSREKYQDYIQTDAAINQGNSGGALLNSKGEMVGMNTAILSRSGGSNGIGFAVPTNMITNIMDQLIAYGEVRRGRIGVTIQNITPALMTAMKLKDTNGALVAQVSPDSPAQKAGLESGDVIIAFNNIDILDSSDIRNAVGLVERGQKAKIAYIRNGKRYSTKIGVEKAPKEETTTKDEVKKDLDPASFDTFDGTNFTDIPTDSGISGGIKGVLISSIKRSSDAYDSGLRKGDVIRAVNNSSIDNLSDFKTEIAKKKGPVFLTVQRGRAQTFIAVK